MSKSPATPHEAVYRRTATGWEDLSALLAGPPTVTRLPGAWPGEPLPIHAALHAEVPWARCTPPYRWVRLPWAGPPWPGGQLDDLRTVARRAGPFAGIVTQLARESVYYVECIAAGAEAVVHSGWNPAGSADRPD